MKSVSSCVLCEGDIRRRARAVAAPFLAKRIWRRPAFPVDLMECRRCGFLFFNPRLESSDEAALYYQYRSDEYQQMRYSVEPWYTKKLNQGLFDPAYMDTRRAKLTDLFRKSLGPVQVRKVLDFGGNDGELVRGLIAGAEPYVYDISGVTPVEGVQRCADLDDCRAHQFDLIINSNVLEHVGFPREVLGRIGAAANPDTLVFLEVPYESPFSLESLLKRAVQGCVLMLTRPGVALSLLGPGALCWMHEHVNFFNPNALQQLVTACGWTSVDAGVYEVAPSTGKGMMTWCLAKLTQD
jgi:hypothetical protein